MLVHFTTCFILYVYLLIAGEHHLVSGRALEIHRPTTSPPILPTLNTHGPVKDNGRMSVRTVSSLGMNNATTSHQGGGDIGKDEGEVGVETNINTFRVLFTSKLSILDLV